MRRPKDLDAIAQEDLAALPEGPIRPVDEIYNAVVNGLVYGQCHTRKGFVDFRTP